jgi:hypothetical protein
MPLQPLLYWNLNSPLLGETEEIKFNKTVGLCVQLHQSSSLCESKWGIPSGVTETTCNNMNTASISNLCL